LSFSRDAFSAVTPWQAAGAEYAGIAPAAIITTAKAIDMPLKFIPTSPLGVPAAQESRPARRARITL
jgi:hypothetical protein